MPIDANLIWLGIALLLTPALAEIGRIRAKAEKGFTWMGASGVLILLAATFGVDVSALGSQTGYLVWGTIIFNIVGLLLALAGTVYIVYRAFVTK